MCLVLVCTYISANGGSFLFVDSSTLVRASDTYVYAMDGMIVLDSLYELLFTFTHADCLQFSHIHRFANYNLELK